MNDATWGRYLRRFHGERPGITEAVLGKARDGATSPYEWAVQALDASGPVLDLACGSAPLRRLIPDLLCIGMDSSFSKHRSSGVTGSRFVLSASFTAAK